MSCWRSSSALGGVNSPLSLLILKFEKMGPLCEFLLLFSLWLSLCFRIPPVSLVECKVERRAAVMECCVVVAVGEELGCSCPECV